MKKKQPELIDAVTIDRYADMLRTSEIFERLRFLNVSLNCMTFKVQPQFPAAQALY